MELSHEATTSSLRHFLNRIDSRAANAPVQLVSTHADEQPRAPIVDSDVLTRARFQHQGRPGISELSRTVSSVAAGLEYVSTRGPDELHRA
jgi:hypothetical protein